MWKEFAEDKLNWTENKMKQGIKYLSTYWECFDTESVDNEAGLGVKVSHNDAEFYEKRSGDEEMRAQWLICGTDQELDGKLCGN